VHFSPLPIHRPPKHPQSAQSNSKGKNHYKIIGKTHE
jgi:hypothetical protein